MRKGGKKSFKGTERLQHESIQDIKPHYKPTETFQYSYFNSTNSYHTPAA